MAVVRVAHVVGKMSGGGVESAVMNYYRHIDRAQIQFDFLVDSDSTIVPSDEINRLGGRVIEIPPYQEQFAYQKTLIDLFRNEQWPIVESHVNALSVFPLHAAKKAGVPVRIAHSHSTSGKGEHKKNLVKTLLKPFANVYPTNRVACSRAAGEWLFGSEANFDIVYNAIELDRFKFDAETRAKTRAALGLSDDALVVGHIGRFTEQKNQSFLVQAFVEVARRRPESVLVLVGTGVQRTSVEEMVRSRGLLDRVKFLGQRRDADRLYQAMDVFALPSLYEGLGIVAIEAQRSGLPCVVSDRITREVDLTGTVEFLPIDDPHSWSMRLAAAVTRSNRSVNPLAFQQYEIGRSAALLARRYRELARCAGRIS